AHPPPGRRARGEAQRTAAGPVGRGTAREGYDHAAPGLRLVVVLIEPDLPLLGRLVEVVRGPAGQRPAVRGGAVVRTGLGPGGLRLRPWLIRRRSHRPDRTLHRRGDVAGHGPLLFADCAEPQ